MNNAFIKTEEKEEVLPALREKATQLAELIEALQNIANSNYWKVVKNVFEVDLDKAKRSLAKEKDTTEMFRLQGELRWESRINLEKLLTSKRNELESIRKKLL